MEDLHARLEELNAELQSIIEKFTIENKLDPQDLIVELDDSYPDGMLGTPTKYGIFWQFNKGGFRSMKVTRSPGKVYESDEILKLYDDAIGNEVVLPWRDIHLMK